MLLTQVMQMYELLLKNVNRTSMSGQSILILQRGLPWKEFPQHLFLNNLTDMKKYRHLFSSVLVLSFFSLIATAQSDPGKNWQNKSIEKDSVYGTGSDEALQFLKNRKSTTVIVAVIDGGTQINHPGLKPNVWTNPKDVSGNKVDDEHNGYVDDIHGWDFIGGKDSDVRQDNLEVTRLYRDLGKKYANVTADKVSKEDMAEYKTYLKVKTDFETDYANTKFTYDNFKGFIDTVNLIKKALGKTDFTKDDLAQYNPSDSSMAKAKKRVARNFKRFQMYFKNPTADSMVKLLQPAIEHYYVSLNYQYNVNFNPRFIVGDNYSDASEKYYGNADVVGPTDEHGTHVAGIIGGVRTGKPDGPEGIADNVKLLIVRVVPDGDERDKDVANGIRYAVDNGAKVINMSFGKGYAYNKSL